MNDPLKAALTAGAIVLTADVAFNKEKSLIAQFLRYFKG
jgi:hypothetical protein